MDWFKAFRGMNMPPGRYVLRYVLPFLAAGLLFSFVLTRFLAGANPALRAAVSLVPPAFMLVVAGLWPLIAADRARAEIDNNIHFFVTHMGVLATANLAPIDIMAKLGEKKEYGALAKAAEEISSLVRSWNMSVPDACRFVADRTFSTIFADFIERLAYAIETGEDLLVFLKNEQAVVMGDYATQYQANLYAVDSVKDMYMSTMMSVIFLVVFGLITPILTGVDPSNMSWMVGGLIVLMEAVFVVLLHLRAPNDRLWAVGGETIGFGKQVRAYLPLTLLLCVAGALASWAFLGLDLLWGLAIATTPLLVLGFPASQHESSIARKDDGYPAFIRSLGASTSARGGSPKDVLKRLRRHDFGPLTADVESLYRRLNLRLDDVRAWERFCQETSSNIIQKFTAMFTEGIAAGGDAGEIGRIVSENVVRILSLRKHRQQTAVGFRGMMIGLTAGMAGTLYIGVGLLGVLRDLFAGAEISDPALATAVPIATMSVDVVLLSIIVTTVMLVHNVIGSYMVAKAGGGSAFRITAHLPLLMWVTALCAWGADKALSTMA